MSEPSIKRLGPYIIQGVLGRGGMGSVFAGQHETTGERAAIKVLAPALAADDVFRERFFAEIDSLKTLNHPHIVQLFGYGEHEGHLYFAMELVEGTNLAQELAAGRRFHWREVTQMGIDISRALKHAHDHGVIHRDLKPANLLMNQQEQVKLTDFGIAKLFGNSHGTSSGSVLGTADYMAPEQAASEGITPRCDLFSLGCVLYALLTGKPPFRGASIAEVVHNVRYEQPEPISKHASDVPRDLQQIIHELMAKNPDDRIRTALSLTHRLRAIQQALSISTTDHEEFSSDTSESDEAEGVVPLVNPPPDIAERPTVVLPDAPLTKQDRSTHEPQGTGWKRDHFTTVEQDSWSVDSRNEFSSAVPLLLLLLTVVGGILGGIWYSSLPLSADQMYEKILGAATAEDPMALLRVRGDVELFLEKYPDHAQFDAVTLYGEDIAVLSLQRQLEVMARGRKETGSLQPIEYHCNEAFRLMRKGDIESAIRTLEGVREFFGEADEHRDIKTQRVLKLVNKVLPRWKKRLQLEVAGLQVQLESRLDYAMEVAAEDPDRARRILRGVQTLYGHRRWARQEIQRAASLLEALDAGELHSHAPEQVTQHEKTLTPESP